MGGFKTGQTLTALVSAFNVSLAALTQALRRERARFIVCRYFATKTASVDGKCGQTTANVLFQVAKRLAHLIAVLVVVATIPYSMSFVNLLGPRKLKVRDEGQLIRYGTGCNHRREEQQQRHGVGVHGVRGADVELLDITDMRKT